MVEENSVSIQSSTNPHIIGFGHYSKEIQIKFLEDGKNTTVKYEDLGAIKLAFENTEYVNAIFWSS